MPFKRKSFAEDIGCFSFRSREVDVHPLCTLTQAYLLKRKLRWDGCPDFPEKNCPGRSGNLGHSVLLEGVVLEAKIQRGKSKESSLSFYLPRTGCVSGGLSRQSL
jgi:hypothetical protein